MNGIHPQLIVFFAGLQQSTQECLVCGDRALMLCAADGAKGTLESQAETFCQIDKTALRRQFTAPTKT